MVPPRERGRLSGAGDAMQKPAPRTVLGFIRALEPKSSVPPQGTEEYSDRIGYLCKPDRRLGVTVLGRVRDEAVPDLADVFFHLRGWIPVLPWVWLASAQHPPGVALPSPRRLDGRREQGGR